MLSAANIHMRDGGRNVKQVLFHNLGQLIYRDVLATVLAENKLTHAHD